MVPGSPITWQSHCCAIVFLSMPRGVVFPEVAKPFGVDDGGVDSGCVARASAVTVRRISQPPLAHRSHLTWLIMPQRYAGSATIGVCSFSTVVFHNLGQDISCELIAGREGLARCVDGPGGENDSIISEPSAAHTNG